MTSKLFEDILNEKTSDNEKIFYCIRKAEKNTYNNTFSFRINAKTQRGRTGPTWGSAKAYYDYDGYSSSVKGPDARYFYEAIMKFESVDDAVAYAEESELSNYVVVAIKGTAKVDVTKLYDEGPGNLWKTPTKVEWSRPGTKVFYQSED